MIRFKFTGRCTPGSAIRLRCNANRLGLRVAFPTRDPDNCSFLLIARNRLGSFVARHPPVVPSRIVRVHAKRSPRTAPCDTRSVSTFCDSTVRRVHAVFAVKKLNHVSGGVSTVPSYLTMMSSIAFTSRRLDVTRLGGLHRGVDETFAATHGVEEELLRGQPSQVRVLDEPSSLGPKSSLEKCGNDLSVETKRDTLPFDVLLTDARASSARCLRTNPWNRLCTVIFTLLCRPTRLARSCRRCLSPCSRSGSPFAQTTAASSSPAAISSSPFLCECDHLLHVTLRLGDGVVDSAHGTVVGDRVEMPHRETVV